jgi:predicted nucleotidyltransferase
MLRFHGETFKNFGILRIGLFGSYARNEMSVRSDIDILVEFVDGQKNFSNYMNVKIFHEDLFKKKVDLVIKDSIKDRIKEQIIKETIYAA